MARYGGGHEDLNEERALLGQVESGLDKLTAKERAARREVEATDEAVSRSTRERERLSRLQREQRQVQERAVEVSNVEAKAIDRTTAAIERNAVAREAAMRAAVNTSRALAGARDPLFGRATALGREGLPPSQYQLRRELGIGSGRAQRLQEAIQAGYAPAPREGGPRQGPLVGQEAVNQANIELAAARRALTRATKRGELEAVNEAQAAVDEAVARRDAAKAQLKSARSADLAAQKDAEAAARAGAPRSTALARRTELIPGALGGGPQTGQAQVFAPGGAGPFAARPGLRGVATPGQEVGRPGTFTQQLEAERTAALQAAAAEQKLAVERTAAARAAGLEARAAANDAVAANATQTERLARATRFSAVEYGTANQQIRQHGTLTSEFIQAALRGETTLRELGNQAIVTAGKFGAWTGAATAIFGAVAAVHQLGTGAIQSSAGVNQLQRVVNNVNGDRLQEQFSDLASQFNVPIEVASDAVYQMGKVFHNQADAVEASKAALYSYKTGEVDVAQSTQNLIAIVNGFGLTAQDLTKVYDQINQAQNKFGIGIGDVEQGLAKAGGTYRNAGGDLNYLLALFVAIQKATGRSGTEIGTGIARGVNEIRKPINQARLKAQGVDVDPQNFQKTLQSGLEAAKKPGADLQQIASGLFGNQYARLIAPVLRDQTRLNQALGDTSPEKSKGSAQRELARVLGSVDEQIKRIGVTLQRLGAGLARAGLGDIPYVLLRGLNLTLDVAVKLIETFDKLPAPLRHALSLFAQIALVMRVIRRFGGLPGIAERVPGAGFLAAPDQRTKNLAVAGARQAQDAADRELERSTARASQLHQRASVQADLTQQYNQRYDARARAGTLPPLHSKERVALEVERAEINAASLAAEREAAAATREANVQRKIALAAEQEKVRLEQLDAATVRQLTEAERLAIPASFNVPERRGAVIPGPGGRVPVGIGGYRGAPGAAFGSAGGGGRDVTRHISEMEAYARQFEEAPRQLGRVERAILPYTSGLRVWGDKLRESNLVTRPVGGVATRVAGVAERAAQSVRGATGTLSRMGTSLRGFASSLGPLDIAILGFFALEGIKAAGDRVIQDQERVLKAIEATPDTAAGIDRQNKAIEAALKRPGTPHTAGQALTPLGEIGQGHIGAGLRDALRLPGAGFSDTLSGRIFKADYEAPWEREDRIRREAELAQGEQDRIKRLQEAARKRGKPVPLQTLDQVRGEMEADAKLREQGVISVGEFDKRMHDHVVEMKTARNQTESQRRETEQLAARLKREASPSLYGRYAGAPVDEIRLRLGNLATVISSGDATGQQIREYGYAYRQLVTKIGNSNDPKQLQQFLADREAYFKALEDGAQAELQISLAAAQTEGQRRAAFRQVDQRLRQIPQADKTQLRADSRRLVDAGQDVVANRSKHAIAQTGREFLQNIIDKGGDAIPGVTAARDKVIEYEKKLDADLKKDQQDIGKFQKNIKADRKRIREAMRRMRRAERANEEAAFQDRQQGRDIDLSLAQSRTRDPLKQAQLAEDAARKELADARQHGTARDRKAAQTKMNQAEQQADDALLARAQALDSVREAQVALRTGGDPVAVARAAEQSAVNTYNFLKAHSNDPTAIAQAYAQVLQTQGAVAQAAQDQAATLAGLQFDLAAARAGGGAAALARAARLKAQYALSHAKNAQQRAQALLDLANANNQTEQAAADAEAARFELLASLTDDPVKKAQYQLKGDRALLRHTHGQAERRRAQARVNDDQRALRDQKLQGKEDDIDFNLEMERISRQTAIDQYQSLLQMHNLTKQQRREILRKIHSLQKEGQSEASGFGLQVGQGVKLPTIYDVRRAISGVRRATDQGTTFNAKTNVTVNVEVTDPDSAGKVFDQIDKALTTGVRSSTRSAGLSL